MESFYTDIFGQQVLEEHAGEIMKDGVAGSIPFSAAAIGVSEAGRIAYNTVMVIAVFVSLIMLLIYLAMLYTSSNAQERTMNKQKVMKAIVTIALIFMTTGIVMSVLGAVYNLMGSRKGASNSVESSISAETVAPSHEEFTGD